MNKKWALPWMALSIFMACEKDQVTPSVQLPDAPAAAAAAEAFFNAYVKVDAPKLQSMLCDADPQHRQQASDFVRRSQAPGSAFAVQRFKVKTTKTAWRGHEPIFIITMAFPRRSGKGEVAYPLVLDARRGCVLDFLGGRAMPQSPGSGQGTPDGHSIQDAGPQEEPIPL